MNIMLESARHHVIGVIGNRYFLQCIYVHENFKSIQLLLQALAKVNEKLKPLEDGCDNNRSNWMRLAEQRKKKFMDEQSKEKENKTPAFFFKLLTKHPFEKQAINQQAHNT